MVTSDVDRIVDTKLKTKHTQAAEEALMDILKTCYAAASAGLKDASYRYVENVLIGMTLKGTLDNLFIRNLELWSQASTFMDAFTQRVLTSRTFIYQLATLVNKLVEKTID